MKDKDVFLETEINDVVVKRQKRIAELETEINFLGNEVGYFNM
jgi:hypothetical protein